MLGANGQSNGCVSFNDYDEFLNAYLRSEITRLAVVEQLDSPPARLYAGQLPGAVKDLLKSTAVAANTPPPAITDAGSRRVSP